MSLMTLTRSMKFVKLVKFSLTCKGIKKQVVMQKARDVHKKMTVRDHKELIYDAKKMTDKEISMLIAIGLRDPARSKIFDFIIERDGGLNFE